MRAKQFLLVIPFFLVAVGFPVTQALYEAIHDDMTPRVIQMMQDIPKKVRGPVSLRDHLHNWDRDAKDKSIFADVIRQAALDFRFNTMRDVGAKVIRGSDDWLFFTPGIEYLIQAPYVNSRFYKDSRDTLVADQKLNLKNPIYAILDFQKQLRDRGIELLIVPVPGKASIYPEKLSASVKDLPPSPTLLLMDELSERGVEVVDLFNALSDAKKKGAEQLYLKRDTHWTPEGLGIAAKTVSEKIHSYPWYAEYVASLKNPVSKDQDSGNTEESEKMVNQAANSESVNVPQASRYSFKKIEVKRWGDIAEMTKIPERHKIWKDETVTAVQVIDQWSHKPYSDDASSPILWLGDSFSRIYQTDEPKSAGVISHLAAEIGFPLASVVNDGGASTIVRQQLYRKAALLEGKKLLIWEFVERDIKFGKDGWKLETLPPAKTL